MKQLALRAGVPPVEQTFQDGFWIDYKSKVERTGDEIVFDKRQMMKSKEQMDFRKAIAYIQSQWRQQNFILVTLTALCLNLAISRLVYASTNSPLQIQFTWAYGVLGAVIMALIIYLFVVVFQPERF